MPLFKFCNPEHNICLGADLKVGTLYGYRTIEQDELKDEGEGKYKFEIEFPEPITLDKRWANLLLQGAIHFGGSCDIPRFPGELNCYTKTLKVISQSQESVTVTNTLISIERDVPNCLIYCMAALDSADQIPFVGYTDHWSIPEVGAEEFARNLGWHIYQQTKCSSFHESFFGEGLAFSERGLSVKIQHGPVVYRDRHIAIRTENMPSYDGLVEILSNIAFMKPKCYAHEKEYRFVFELSDGQVIYPPKTQHLLINSMGLISL